MSHDARTERSIQSHNLRVVLFNWLPALGCLAVGVVGLVTGAGETKSPPSVGGGLYLIAAALAFAAFGWLWRNE